MIEPLIKGNDNINVIMYEWEEFSTYKLKEKWISNHHMNDSLNSKIHWKLKSNGIRFSSLLLYFLQQKNTKKPLFILKSH